MGHIHTISHAQLSRNEWGYGAPAPRAGHFFRLFSFSHFCTAARTESSSFCSSGTGAAGYGFEMLYEIPDSSKHGVTLTRMPNSSASFHTAQRRTSMSVSSRMGKTSLILSRCSSRFPILQIAPFRISADESARHRATKFRELENSYAMRGRTL